MLHSVALTAIFNTREAEEDTLRIMKEHVPQDWRVHVHCFTDSLAFAKNLLAHFSSLCIGFTGVITFKNAQDVQKVVSEVPLERILLETDGPFMAPIPHRGKVRPSRYLFCVWPCLAPSCLMYGRLKSTLAAFQTAQTNLNRHQCEVPQCLHALCVFVVCVCVCVCDLMVVGSL